MHTPEQALELWCPMVRLAAVTPDGTVASGQTVMNRLQNGHYSAVPDAASCIANRCAMWRWGTEPDPKWVRPNTPPGSFMPQPFIQSDRGFCGLAGPPAVAA